MADKSQWQTCDLCDKKRNVNWKCLECRDILCDICKQRHMKGRLTSKHKMINKNEQKEEENIRAQFECDLHFSEQIHMFCVRCDVPVCRLCMEVKHKRHEVTRIAHGANLIRDKLAKAISETEKTYFPQIQSLLSKFYALKFQFESENLKVNRSVEGRLRLFNAASNNKADKLKKENMGRDGEHGMLYVNKIKALHAELQTKRERINECRENLLSLNDHVLVKKGVVLLTDLNTRFLVENIIRTTPDVPLSNITTDDIDEQLLRAIYEKTGSTYERSFVSRPTQTEEALTIIVTDGDDVDPTWANIKQQYNGIFEVEWKMAYDAVQRKRNLPQAEIVALLLELLKQCFEHCKNMASEQWNGIVREISMQDEDTEENKVSEVFGSNRFNHHISDLKEIRKAAAPYTARKIEQILLKSTDFTDSFGDDIIEGCTLYISKCIDVCWMIAVHEQTPCIQWNVDGESPINDSIHRRFNSERSGSTIDYLVWPAILVYPDGPVICKGAVEVIHE